MTCSSYKIYELKNKLFIKLHSKEFLGLIAYDNFDSMKIKPKAVYFSKNSSVPLYYVLDGIVWTDKLSEDRVITVSYLEGLRVIRARVNWSLGLLPKTTTVNGVTLITDPINRIKNTPAPKHQQANSPHITCG